MKIFVDGNVSDALRAALTSLVREINLLAGNGFQTEIVADQDDSNVYLYFGSADGFLALFDYDETIIQTSFGFFNIFRIMDTIYAARIFIDTERTNLTDQKHALREEVTQVLGLGRDSESYSNSIFFQGSSEVTAYSSIDKEIIRLLYHPSMQVGLNQDEVAKVLREVLRAE